jgi:hypothetical protein
MPKPRLALAAVATAALLAVPFALRAGDGAEKGAPQGAPPPAWPTSPYHGVISGATGEPIPCRCRYRDSDFRLGDTVCMNTYRGVQMARCDLFLNNTSWVPIGIPCTMSHVPRHLAGPSPARKEELFATNAHGDVHSAAARGGSGLRSLAAGMCSRRPVPM